MREEQARLVENAGQDAIWHRWGPYVSERQWGTVREDYSADGNAWEYFPHDQARSRAYRWGEDGLAGFSDEHGNLNLGVALWNEKDPILKERLFGLTNNQGNHGEDVKECYWYVDATPTHSYLRMIYRYPHAEFPYQELLDRNAAAGKLKPEVELSDLGVFDEDRYFEVQVEYAKQSPERIFGKISVTNRGPDAATLHVLPTAWFRNTWSWTNEPRRPGIAREGAKLHIHHLTYGSRWLVFEQAGELLFTENETNRERLFGVPNPLAYVKDAFHRYLIQGEKGAVHPDVGTKAAAHYRFELKAGETQVIRFALLDTNDPFPVDCDELFGRRAKECEEFYEELTPNLSDAVKAVQRQAFAGMIWSKQSYHFDVETWLDGDSAEPPPPPGRTRNDQWRHLHTSEVLSMPDTWEYPWFASWDLAFHTIPFALVDPKFAKGQLITLLREWYLHPNGQVPAYEWSFSDVNPPVHAWAAWRIFLIERRQTGHGDTKFLERVFHKLLLNFTWWVNRKDITGNNVFEGGFLGLDNIGVFDRNNPLPDGSFAEQSDGTAWMAMFCLNMLEIALELASEDSAYEDVASKFFEHFLYISAAMNRKGMDGAEMWDEEDGYYYDVLRHPDGRVERMRVRSGVGFIPVFAITTFEPEQIERFPGFRDRMAWFLKHRHQLAAGASSMQIPGQGERLLLSILTEERLKRVLARVLDPSEFLSQFGVRSVSRVHLDHPYVLDIADREYMLKYEPGESTTGTFGGNSNWRGPIWFPLNYLLIESLQKFDFYFGSDMKLTSGNSPDLKTLAEIAADLEAKMLAIFTPGLDGKIPLYGGAPTPVAVDGTPLLWFNEYFHGETGKGLGASHQTGWTGVIAKIIQQLYVTSPDLR